MAMFNSYVKLSYLVNNGNVRIQEQTCCDEEQPTELGTQTIELRTSLNSNRNVVSSRKQWDENQTKQKFHTSAIHLAKGLETRKW